MFVQLTTSGTGGAYEFALLFQPGDMDLFYVPSNQQAPPAPLGGSLGRTQNGGGRVTISNPGTASFQQFEVAPIGFRADGVATADCGVTEGGGIACQRPLGPGKTAVVRFSGAVPDSSSAYLLATSAGDTGLAYVPYGDACPDSAASSTRLRSEASIVRAHIAVMSRNRAAKRFLAPLRRKLAALEKQIAAAQRGLLRCEQTGRKAAAASACDAKMLSVGHASGREAGLRDVLPTERRVAAKVKALRSLPASTQKKLAAAKAQAQARDGGVARLRRGAGPGLERSQPVDEARSYSAAIVPSSSVMSCSAPGMTTTSASGFRSPPRLHACRAPVTTVALRRGRAAPGRGRRRRSARGRSPSPRSRGASPRRRASSAGARDAEPVLVQRGHEIGAQRLLVNGTIVDGVLEAAAEIERPRRPRRPRSPPAGAGAPSRTSSAADGVTPVEATPTTKATRFDCDAASGAIHPPCEKPHMPTRGTSIASRTASASSTWSWKRPREASPVDSPSPRRSNETTPIPAGGRTSWRCRYSRKSRVPSPAPCSATSAVSPPGEYVAASEIPSRITRKSCTCLLSLHHHISPVGEMGAARPFFVRRGRNGQCL